MRLDSVRIGAVDLDAAVAAYTLLLGTDGTPRPDGGRRFQLVTGAVEIVRGADAIESVRFTTDEGETPPALPAAMRGLTVVIEPGPGHPPPASEGAAALAIDHVVVQSADPDGAIALWRDGLGLRLALDRVFAARGLRLLFFRSGGITLEYATPHPPPADHTEGDRLYGMSYRVADLRAHREHLLAAGMDVSEVRVGMRPGTSVATVRAGTAGVPTLLLQVESSPG